MEKNKSIDGLASRSEKAARTVVEPRPDLKPESPTMPSLKPASEPKPTTKKSESKSEPQPKPTSAPKATKKSKPVTTSPAEDFLKPVQAFDFDENSGELTKSKEPIKKEIKGKKEKKKSKNTKNIIASIIIIIVLLVLIGIGIGLIVKGNDFINGITGGQGNIFDLLTFVEDKYEPLKTDSNGRTNILAFGTSGYNMDGEEGKGTHAGAQLTDSIMVISLNQETGDIAMLSLPRDLKASPTCTATGKINEIYWCNNMYGENEKAGATALMVEVGSILNIDFQYYAHINWGSLVEIVDALGGITINLDEGIYDYNSTGAVFDPHTDYTINGEQALGLARARYGTASGDFSRGASQQKILIGIKNRILEKDLSLIDIINLANALGDNLRTNFTVEEIKTLAHLTSDFDFDVMRQISLLEPTRYMTTGTINKISYVLPSAGAGNYTAIRSYVAKMLSNNPLDYENASIIILNGTDQVGIASTEKIALEDDGFTKVDTDNAPEGEYHGKYTIYSLSNSTPGIRRILEEKYHTKAKSADDLPADITKDYDYVIILGDQS